MQRLYDQEMISYTIECSSGSCAAIDKANTAQDGVPVAREIQFLSFPDGNYDAGSSTCTATHSPASARCWALLKGTTFGEENSPPSPSTPVTFPVAELCFSGENVVDKSGKGSIKMSELEVGDYIKAARDKGPV